MTLRMPAQWAPHERSLLGWPCREAMWREHIGDARRETAATANAIAEFEPVTMVCATDQQAHDAAQFLSANVDIVVIPMDGSWLRDNGPIYVTEGGSRVARHYRFNGYGEYQAVREKDARLGQTLARHLGDDVTPVDLYLEGGAIAVDGAGTVVVTEYCLLHPNRNWHLTREEVDRALRESLGADRVIWLPAGLVQDRGPGHTDGHTDLFFQFTGVGRALLNAPTGPNDVNSDVLTQARDILTAAGIEIVDVPLMPEFTHDGETIIAPHLNLYICNGGVIVPVSGAEPDQDDEALAIIAAALPLHQVVPVHMRAHPTLGGAIHCITQQVPVKEAS